MSTVEYCMSCNFFYSGGGNAFLRLLHLLSSDDKDWAALWAAMSVSLFLLPADGHSACIRSGSVSVSCL